ncbi:MAG: carboxypeptidase regulatory-like domain-containing protein, partial [Vicinamibacterales bacterium]
ARTVFSEGDGRYTIVDLRPGTYTLVYSLPGFGTVRREGLVLPADFVATVNVQLSVGALEESVTVSGQSPLVDVSMASRTEVINRELLDSLPTPRNTQSFGYLAQGVRLSKPDVGGAQMMEQVNMRVHGASQLHTTMQIDGMLVSPAFNDGAIQNYMNQAHFAETSFTTSSQSAEVSAGGIRLNMIPNDGGNDFRGTFYLGFTDGSWQSNNLTDELRALGVESATGITNIHDFNPSYGGPIVQNKLWFYGSFRRMSVDEKVLNAFMPDGSDAIVDQYIVIPLLRLTYQITPSHKVSGFLDRPFKYKGREFSFGIEPAFASRRRNWGEANYHNMGFKLTSTLSSRVLFELGFTEIVERLHSGYQPATFPTTAGWPRPATVRTCVVTPCAYDPTSNQFGDWYHDVAHEAILTNERTVATTGYGGTLPDRRHITTALSYISGAHTVKGGFQWSWGQDRNDGQSNGDIDEQGYRNGVPEYVTVNIDPFATQEYVKADMGFYIQDTIRWNRLTMTPGLRYEYFNSMVKEQWRQPGRWVEGRIFDEIKGLPIWHNVVPRFGATYDLFGDGRTALKFGANLYTRPMAGSFAKRYNPLRGAATDQRDWFDAELVPGTNQRSGVPRPTDGDDIVQDWEVGPRNNQSFGIAPDRRPEEGIKRETNREYTVSVQRQILSGLSVTAGWYRRTYHNLIGEDNLLVDPAVDYTPFQVANPIGNGEILTIYNLNLDKRGQVQILDFNSDENTHISNDLELSFNSRLPNGSTVFGGWTAMKNVAVTCDLENPNGTNQSDLYYAITFLRGGRFCDERELDIPYRHDFKIAGTLPLPYGFEFSGTIVSFAGNEFQTVWNVPASQFPGGQRTTTTNVRLTAPGSEYLDRWNQVDIAFKKTFNFGGRSFTAQADVYNLLNGANVTTATTTFGPNLRFPNTILQGRLLRLVAQARF